jgi:hypothetical protein
MKLVFIDSIFPIVLASAFRVLPSKGSPHNEMAV